MMKLPWSVVELAGELLPENQRDAVLGDLLESGEGHWQSLAGVLGLALRQRLGLWKSWRPWLAAFGLAFPCSLLLMGFSISVSQRYLEIVGPGFLKATGFSLGQGFFLLLCNILLLLAWSWTGGFVMGSISRRTVWISAVLSFLPCLFCLGRFHMDSLSRFCLLLFLPPAIWGVIRGLKVAQIRLGAAVLLALGITLLTLPTWQSHSPWMPNWMLSWPAWYLVATSEKPEWMRRIRFA